MKYLSTPFSLDHRPKRLTFLVVLWSVLLGASSHATQSIKPQSKSFSAFGKTLRVGRLDASHLGPAGGNNLTGQTGGFPGVVNSRQVQGPRSQVSGQSYALGDPDNDNLTTGQENTGWDIVIDTAGYGAAALGSLLTIRTVTSDPNLADTDGDGLTDDAEFLIGSDPRSVDTDGDGLTDDEEWNKWFTNPNTVDTDADSRGPDHNLTPDAFLFDGQELAPDTHITSPSLADTDGDGRTDQEELYVPVFHPLIAELPRADIIIAGDLDIRLDIEYEESIAGEVGYEVSLSSSQSSTLGREESDSTAQKSGQHVEASRSDSWGVSVSGGASIPSGLTSEWTASGGQSVTNSESRSLEISQESVFTTSASSSQESGLTHSSYVSDTHTYTESYASGTVTLPIRIANVGPFSYSVTNLGITLLKYDRPAAAGESGTYKAMGTIFPQLNPATLAPGEESTILTLSSGAMNPDVIKEFMAAPNTLILQPASFNLVDQNGIDFDFIQESAFSQTALIEVDFGGGETESYRVATNVDRDGATYNGVRLGDALSNVLELDYQVDPLSVNSTPVLGPGGDPIRVLTELDGRATINSLPGVPTQQVWVVLWDGDLSTSEFVPDTLGGHYVDFESIRLLPGDSVRLILSRDQDGDDLWEAEELLFGTSDLIADEDTDGLTDREEAVEGWALDPTLNDDRMVYSDPLSADTDHDGMDDGDEKLAGLDPRNPDSDQDGILDGEDPYPGIAAGRMYISLSGQPEPAPWLDGAGPSSHLLLHFQEVDLRNSDADPLNDIAEIWIASGTYEWFELPFPRGNVKILGGFHVGDEKLGQRDPDPLTNGTLIGVPIYNEVVAEQGEPNGTLDGFTLSMIYSAFSRSALEHSYGVFTLKNLLIANNRAHYPYFRAAVKTPPRSGPGLPTLVMEDCDLVNNANFGDGGAIEDHSSVYSTFTNCEFSFNISNGIQVAPTEGGGGAYFRKLADPFYSGEDSQPAYLGRPTFIGCQFVNNWMRAWGPNSGERGGGAAWIDDWGAIFQDCDFVGNIAVSQTPDPNYGTSLLLGTEYFANDGGALFFARDPLNYGRELSLTNCRFFGNGAGRGSAIFVEGLEANTASYRILSLNNCSFGGNYGFLKNVGPENPGGLVQGSYYPGYSQFLLAASFFAENCVSAGNYGAGLPTTNGFTPEELWGTNGFSNARSPLGTRFCVIEAMPSFGPGWTNLAYDPSIHGPLFQSLATGNLRLASGSLAIDFGNNLIDTDHQTSGIQPLPPLDLDGNPRFRDGSGIGQAKVDAGAYEFQ
ncbi:MAG: hypothetical protein ACI87O_000720 [Planctomycetota bacterium]|jgi:hypothetical protein